MKTFTATPDDISHDWHVVDAAGVPLGRLASVVAQLIRGKHKPTYTPHMDGGDFVVVVNAEKVRLTGRKMDNKKYFSHTGYMGHEASHAARDLLAKHPDRVIEKAVFGMLPKTSLAQQKLRGKLKVYAGAEHPHAAQQPKPFSVTPSEGERMTAAPEFRWQAVGRRKTSVARVYLTPGTGKWDINGRTLGDYFPRPSLVQHIQQSFTATDTLGAFDVKAHVDGGGQAGQAGALRLGIARALVEADGQHRTKLRAAGLMTRDPRAVERKKPGRPGARKRFQFSKR